MVAELRFHFRCVLVLAMAFRVVPAATTDTRPLGRPQARKEPSFEFVLKSYEGAPVTEEAPADYGQDSLQELNALFSVPSQVLSGSSLQLLLSESGNGVEGGRKLRARGNTAIDTARVAQLSFLLRTTFQGDLRGFEEKLERFGNQVRQYEITSETIFDGICQVLLKTNTAAEVQLQIELRDSGAAQDLCQVPPDTVRARGEFQMSDGASSSQSPAPAKAGALDNGKGPKGRKGKGGEHKSKSDKGTKGKEEERDKDTKEGRTSKFDGWCSCCGEYDF